MDDAHCIDRVPDPASILPSIQRVDKLMTARKAQLERIKFRQAPPPPKQEEVGGDAAKTLAPTPPGPTAEEKEKVFQKDENLRGLESVCLVLLSRFQVLSILTYTPHS